MIKTSFKIPKYRYKVEKMDVKTGKWTKVGKTTEPEFDVTGLITGKE